MRLIHLALLLAMPTWAKVETLLAGTLRRPTPRYEGWVTVGAFKRLERLPTAKPSIGDQGRLVGRGQ